MPRFIGAWLGRAQDDGRKQASASAPAKHQVRARPLTKDEVEIYGRVGPAEFFRLFPELDG